MSLRQQKALVVIGSTNPHDQKARDYGLFVKDSLPGGLGNDVVGEVTVLGEGVCKYAVGDHIFTQACFKSPGWSQNGLQEYAIVEAEHSAKVPTGFGDDNAATLPCNIVASLFAICDGLGIPAPWTSEATSFDYKGTSLLILGGGSNTGKFGVQLAALFGIGRIVVVGGDAAELRSYGATHVVDRHGSPEEVTARIRGIVGDDLVYAYDAVNPPATQHIGINALSAEKKGKLARLLPIEPPNESQIKSKKSGYELKDIYGVSLLMPDLTRPLWERLPQYLVEGKIRPSQYTVVKGLDAEMLNEVLDNYAGKKKVAKTNFHVQE